MISTHDITSSLPCSIHNNQHTFGETWFLTWQSNRCINMRIGKFEWLWNLANLAHFLKKQKHLCGYYCTPPLFLLNGKNSPQNKNLVPIGIPIFLLSHIIHNQIWLNILVNDYQFGYITILKKKPYMTFNLKLGNLKHAKFETFVILCNLKNMFLNHLKPLIIFK